MLRLIATQGAKGLMQGDVAQAMVTKVQGHAGNPGLLSIADLANYQPKQRAALCHNWRAAAKDYSVCGFPPPSSGAGAIAIGQILGMLAHTPASALGLEQGLPSSTWLHGYTEAARLTFADRAQYVADPDFVQAPGGNSASLLDPAYLAERATLIGPRRMSNAPAGTPGTQKIAFAPCPNGGIRHQPHQHRRRARQCACDDQHD